jgi:hypothetical protein
MVSGECAGDLWRAVIVYSTPVNVQKRARRLDPTAQNHRLLQCANLDYHDVVLPDRWRSMVGSEGVSFFPGDEELEACFQTLGSAGGVRQ